MKYKVMYTAGAKKDLRNIFRYISEELLAPENAAGQTERIMTAIRKLDTMPNRNRLYEEEPWYSRGLRFFPVDNYLVFYKTDDETETVYVVRIMYGGRDVHKQLSQGTLLNSYADGGAQEFGMRAGTENIPAIVGMAIALKRNCADMDSNIKHILYLESSLMNRLESSNLEFKRNGGVNIIPVNISLSFRNVEGEMILHRLDLKGICVSTGSALKVC